MGDYYQIIVDRDATLAEAQALAISIRGWATARCWCAASFR